MGPKSFPNSLRQDAVLANSLEQPESLEICPAEAEIHLTIEAEPLTGFRQLAKQIRQYPTDHAFDLNEGINHKAYFQGAKDKANDKIANDKIIDQYLKHPTFGLGPSGTKAGQKTTSKVTKAHATSPSPDKRDSIKEWEPERIARSHRSDRNHLSNPQKLLQSVTLSETLPEEEALPFPEKDQKRTLESLFPVKPFVSNTPPKSTAINSTKAIQKANVTQKRALQKPTLVRFVSPFQMTPDQDTTQDTTRPKPTQQSPSQEELSLDALNDALSQQFNQRITAKTKPVDVSHRHNAAQDWLALQETAPEETVLNEFETQTEPMHPQQVALMERLADFQALAQKPQPLAVSNNIMPEPPQIQVAAKEEIPKGNRLDTLLEDNFATNTTTPILRDQFLTRDSLRENGLSPDESPSLEIGMDGSGLDLVLANALLEEALPRPMGTPRVHQRIQDQMKAMDFSTIYKETNWKHLPAATINPTEFFDPDLLDELNWAYPASDETGKLATASNLTALSQQPLSINYEEATAIMQQHLADLHPDLSIQIDTKPKKIAPKSRFSDTLSPKMEQGSFETQNRGSRSTAPSHPENFVIRGVKLKEIRSMGGNMSNLSGYKDLSKAPAAFGEEEKTDLGQTPFHAGANSLAASFGPAPGLTHETFAPAEMPSTQVAETDYNSNFQTLIRLINELPEGVTKQTGAQIIRLTMESMGIFMEDVLSDAQAAQSEMLDAVRANIKKIEEYKTVIRKLETDIKYYQTKANELSEIIDLFILSNTAGKSGLD
jgi:hypothetical protein